jgi:hypothetical protein
VLNPNCSQSEKTVWKEQLEDWNQRDVCPLENPDVAGEANNEVVRVRDVVTKRTVFSRAIQTCSLGWKDSKLQKIIGQSGKCDEGYHIWTGMKLLCLSYYYRNTVVAVGEGEGQRRNSVCPIINSDGNFNAFLWVSSD